MDQPGLSEGEHRAALAGLKRINMVSGGVPRLWDKLCGWGRSETAARPLRVLDLACGGGDNAIRLAALARRWNVPLTIHGCDRSATALKVASEVGRRSGLTDLKFFALDLLRAPIPEGYDVVMCSLFLHHLDYDQCVELIRQMAAAAERAILIDDLLRTVWGLVLCQVGCQILSRSRIVHTDGPRSVKAAYSLNEVRQLAAQCGLERAQIERHWPQRFLLAWERP